MTWLAPAAVLPVIAWTILLTRLSGDRRGWLTNLPGAVGLALGTSSVVWWAGMCLPLGSRTALIAIDAALWAIVCLAIWTWCPRWPAAAREGGSYRRGVRWPSLTLLVVALTAAAVYFAAASVTMPHGSWDAWAIWNARARFLFRGYPGVWTETFTPALDWSHPDYPLLVPASVARAWTYLGRESVTAPILLAATFCAGIVATAAMSVARSAGLWRGVVTAVMVLASPAFLTSAVSQCADLPLASYILATCVFVGRATEADARPAWWVIAGVGAGLAAWTKNEGVVFAAIVFVVCAVSACRSREWRGLARIAPLVAGAAPILAALVLFKVFLAPPNDLVAGQSFGHVLSNLQDVPRLEIVATAVGRELWFGGAIRIGVLPILALFLLAAGIRRPVPTGAMLGLAFAAALIAADILAYVLTPHDLAWHLSTSLSRLIVQVFPAVIWCGMQFADEPRVRPAADGARPIPESGLPTEG